jgi:hypothetical protein
MRENVGWDRTRRLTCSRRQTRECSEPYTPNLESQTVDSHVVGDKLANARKGNDPKPDEGKSKRHECEAAAERGRVGCRAACKEGDDAEQRGHCGQERAQSEDVACRPLDAVAREELSVGRGVDRVLVPPRELGIGIFSLWCAGRWMQWRFRAPVPLWVMGDSDPASGVLGGRMQCRPSPRSALKWRGNLGVNLAPLTEKPKP